MTTGNRDEPTGTSDDEEGAQGGAIRKFLVQSEDATKGHAKKREAAPSRPKAGVRSLSPNRSGLRLGMGATVTLDFDGQCKRWHFEKG